jgi:hypothetical protein
VNSDPEESKGAFWSIRHPQLCLKRNLLRHTNKRARGLNTIAHTIGFCARVPSVLVINSIFITKMESQRMDHYLSGGGDIYFESGMSGATRLGGTMP